MKTILKAIVFFMVLSGMFLFMEMISFSGVSYKELTPIDLGNPKPGTFKVVTPGKDYNVKGYGRMIGHHVKSDEGRYCYTQVTGDFDISVRIDCIVCDTPSVGSAGILVRKDLTPATCNELMIHANANEYCGQNCNYAWLGHLGEGCKYTGAHSDLGFWQNNSCAHPRPYPNVWLRLTRVGDVYQAYVKQGNINNSWEMPGSSYTADLGPNPYVGIYISANEHGGSRTNGVYAQFRDLQGIPGLPAKK